MTIKEIKACAALSLVLVLCLGGCEAQKKKNGQAESMGGSQSSAPAWIIGEVVLQDQTDASGVQVYIPGTNHVSISDKQGRYSLRGLDAGTYEVMARADGFEQASLGTAIILPSSKPQQYTLASVTLVPRVKTKPAVTDKSNLGAVRGQATIAGMMPGAIGGVDWTHCFIELEKTPYRTTCAPDGTFFLWSLPPDQYMLVARLEGFEAFRTNIRVLPGPGDTQVVATLKPTTMAAGDRRIRGIVELIAADGKPTNDFDRITVHVIGRPDLVTGLDADGSFLFEHLAPTRYRLAASGQGYTASSPVEADLTNIPEINIQLTLHSSEQSSGTMARIHGVALKNVENVSDMSGINIAIPGTSLMATTNDVGEYGIEDIPPGKYTVLAQAEGFEKAESEQIELKAGDNLEMDGLLLEPIRDYPKVLGTDPTDGARGVVIRIEIPLLVRFSKKMDPESLRRAVTIEPKVAYKIYTGKEAPDTDFDLMKIILYGTREEPVARFRTRYTLTISKEARDVTGLGMRENFSMSFTTGDPAVINTYPANGGVMQDMGPAQPVIIFFNAPMNPSTITADTLRIQPRLQSSPNMAIYNDPTTGWTQLNIMATWQPATTYRLTVMGRVRTIGNNPLANTPYTFSFRTAKLTTFEQPRKQRMVR